MVLKLYSHGISTSAQRVICVLVEKKVPFEIIEVDIVKGEHKEPAYKEMQPWGLLPVLVSYFIRWVQVKRNTEIIEPAQEEENGFRLYESRAICRYIAEKYADQGTQLVPAPTDLEARGLFEQGLAMEAGTVDPCVFAALNEKLFKPFKTGASCDDELYVVLLKRVELVLDVYEVILGKQRYIGGNQYSLADIYHLPNGFALQTQCDEQVFLNEKRPNVARWWSEITGRDAWKQVGELNKPGMHTLE
ncbi:glutathione S-transferase III [Lentinula boryana]|uniref:glutathione transferase n=1 Tax=Lentinula boryana TaxID=40481 RepID=A0ABQ8Q375_9AGAR|nr:glutathione S-transferase III [Lentinula boryana]